MASGVDAITECWLHWPMIDQKCRHLHAVVFVNNALLNVGGRNHDSLLRELFIHVAPHVDIEIESFEHVVHHFFGTGWTPDPERRLAPAGPASQEDIRHRQDVIRVQVSKKNLIDLLLPNTGFGQPDDGGSSAVEQQLLPASLNQDGWTISLGVGGWTSSRAQNHNFQGGVWRRWR